MPSLCWKLSFIYNPIDGNVMFMAMFFSKKMLLFSKNKFGDLFFLAYKFAYFCNFIEIFSNFLISQNWGKKIWSLHLSVICSSTQFWSQYQNPIASIITTCPTHSLKKALLREGGSHREGVGGSGVMLNQSYKIWLGPRTMVRSQQSHIPTKLY